ncbi:MAG: hypothetical protein QM768_20330 [Agriterribacter sp.]
MEYKKIRDTKLPTPVNGTAAKFINAAFADQTTDASAPEIVRNLAGKSIPTFSIHTFYHPHIERLTERLNRGGVDMLLKADTDTFIDDYDQTGKGKIQADDDGNTFKTYVPGSAPDGASLITGLSASDKSAYYRENIDFCNDGAYAKYNWELFYHVPLYIATRLSNNGKYAEAMQWFHYIFDPTTNAPVNKYRPNDRYWEFAPFKTSVVENIEEIIRSLPTDNSQDPQAGMGEKFLKDPFKPFIVARLRTGAFMKYVIMRYLDNLIAWGDELYRLNTMESINEATQLYITAAHILGVKPQKIPEHANTSAETFSSLKDKWSTISDVLTDAENSLPYSSNFTTLNKSYSSNLLGVGSVLYFCIPANNDLLAYWTKVGDRLFNIRHCKNIEGVDQVLSLFAPKISPGLLIKARAQGLSISDALSDTNTPPSFYRFNYLLQKANEYCNEVKALGNALLSALEKKDAEELSRLRAGQETALLDLVTSVKEMQVLEARVAREGLLKNRETAEKRRKYYGDLLGLDTAGFPEAPAIPQITGGLKADTDLPGDTNPAEASVTLNTALTNSDESGVKLIPREKEELEKSRDAFILHQVGAASENMAGIFHMFPTTDIHGTPFGVGVAAGWGGQNLGFAASCVGKTFQLAGDILSYQSSLASKYSSYIRREQEWVQQANIASREITQIDKQITAADIRIEITKKELANHLQQLDNAKIIEQKLKDKFTNQELYTWMKEQLYSTFKQAYQMAYEIAQKAEKAYRFELGKSDSNFIQYGYWDSSYQGLMAGDRLQLALKQLEKSFMQENRREFELTKHISLVQLNPMAVIQLKETGACNVDLPEEIFDLDYPGHYFRRIKSVSISMPCVSGPYTTINSTLRLMQNSIRITSAGDKYEPNNDNGNLTDDPRFVENNIPFKAIATSSAQNDSGLFELNFRDERYLPFEGAGVISKWKFELNGKYANKDGTITDLSQFDYDSISDIIIHVKYTAREDAGEFRNKAVKHLQDYVKNLAGGDNNEPFMRLFSVRHEFPDEWYNFLTKKDPFENQLLSVNLAAALYPFFTANKDIHILKLELFAKSKEQGLAKKGMRLLLPTDMPFQGTDPATKGVLKPMTNIVSGNLLQADFTVNATTGAFAIVNDKDSGFRLSRDNINDLGIIVYYHLKDKVVK